MTYFLILSHQTAVPTKQNSIQSFHLYLLCKQPIQDIIWQQYWCHTIYQKTTVKNAHDNSHPCGHYVAALKRNWRYVSSFQHQLILDYFYDGGNEKVPVMNPVDSLLKVGFDDKTSITVGRNVPLASVQNQLCWAPMLTNMPLLACNHSWACDKIIPSVIQVMNNSPDSGDSLFSSGPIGNGQTFVAFHDATLVPLSGRNNNMPSFLFL